MELAGQWVEEAYLEKDQSGAQRKRNIEGNASTPILNKQNLNPSFCILTGTNR